MKSVFSPFSSRRSKITAAQYAQDSVGDVISSIPSDRADSLRSSQAGMAGFFVIGLLLGMLGSLVIAWRYHTDTSPELTGLHFLGVSLGFLIASQVFSRHLLTLPLRMSAITALGLAFISLAALALVAPPAPTAWRIGLLTLIGAAAGGLTHVVFHANQSSFADAPAAATNRAGALFMAGGLFATAVSGCTYFDGSLRIQATILSLVPAAYLFFFISRPAAKSMPTSQPQAFPQDPLQDLSRIVASLFSLLLFFQFACEWAVIGWLPLFLIHTLGVNPATAIWSLALYFFSLIIGRLGAQLLLPVFNHRRMLLVSVAASVAGYLLLSMTTLPALALIAASLIGLAHAPVFPLISEQLDERLCYRAAFHSRVISFALSGGIATPWLLGVTAEHFGMTRVMLIPCAASILVLALALLIMLEAHLMSRNHNDDKDQGFGAAV